MSSNKFTYKQAGVDINAADRLVSSIKQLARTTHNASVISDIGGFGGLFKLDLQSLANPVLVSSTDGVGTKLKVAFRSKTYDTIGADLVNHCVNDIAVCGAKPLFFLDYLATGKLKQHVANDIIRGIVSACKKNNCALIGGETAEMPDFYAEDEFDLAGSITGIVDESRIINGKKIKKGDILLGLKSNGLHTNGYSLARKVLFNQYDVDSYIPDLSVTLGEELLKVHRTYLKPIELLKEIDGVHGLAHITGGGIYGNTKRLLSEDLTLEINWDSLPTPRIFTWIKELGNVDDQSMREAFNLGIGLVIISDAGSVSEIKKTLDLIQEPAFEIGYIQ
jgi:phosphoribosylformylglycinamidine cyclo-ligase